MFFKRAGYPSNLHIIRIIQFLLLLSLPDISPYADTSDTVTDQHGPSLRLEKGVLLVASRRMNDPRFRQTVILVTEYNKQGAIGIIVNRPTDIDLAEIFPEVEALKDHAIHPYLGGPVHPTWLSVLINSDQSQKDMLPVVDNVFFGLGTGFVINLVSEMNKDDRLHVYFGYAGWAAGQLEVELHRGDWHIMKGDVQAIFDKNPADVWREYISLAAGIWL